MHSRNDRWKNVRFFTLLVQGSGFSVTTGGNARASKREKMSSLAIKEFNWKEARSITTLVSAFEAQPLWENRTERRNLSAHQGGTAAIRYEHFS
jgi:hypothetical protein